MIVKILVGILGMFIVSVIAYIITYPLWAITYRVDEDLGYQEWQQKDRD